MGRIRGPHRSPGFKTPRRGYALDTRAPGTRLRAPPVTGGGGSPNRGRFLSFTRGSSILDVDGTWTSDHPAGGERRVPSTALRSRTPRGMASPRAPWGILLSAPAMETGSALSRFAWRDRIPRPWYRWPPGLRSSPIHNHGGPRTPVPQRADTREPPIYAPARKRCLPGLAGRLRESRKRFVAADRQQLLARRACERLPKRSGSR